MGNYYALKGDIYGIEDESLYRGFDDQLWLTGKKLAKPPKLKFKMSRAKLTDVVALKYGCLLLSPRAVAALDALGVTTVEYVPVQLLPKRGEPDSSYCMANVVGRFACLDRKHADVQTFTGSKDIMSLYRYRLLESKLPKKPPLLLRLAEFRWHTIAHAAVKKAFEAAKIRGAEFVPTEKYV